MPRRSLIPSLSLVLLLYLVLGWRYATNTPPWQVPDEPAHYNYIRQLAETGAIPVIEIGDWDTEYQNQLTATGFHPDYLGELDRVQYEDHQPPLYYMVAAPVYRVSDGNPQTLRLFSVLLGVGVVLCAFAVICKLFPEAPWLAVSTAAFVAFLPQNLSIMSGINNDVLAELVAGLTLLFVVHYHTQENDQEHVRCAFLIGVMVGLAFLTKSTVYFLAGIGVLAILLKWRRLNWSLQQGFRQLGAYLLPALVLGAIWWVHNLDVYGGTDFLGLQRHDQVAAGQLQTDAYIDQHLNGDRSAYFRNYLSETFHSFWGQFGWMGVPMPGRIYDILWMYTLLSGAGIILFFKGEYRAISRVQREVLLLLTLTMAAVAAAYMLYNLQFKQFQGRYLFAALIPIGFFNAAGLAGWASVFSRRMPQLRWLSSVPMSGLAFLAWYALDTYIVPNLPRW